jgi:hydrogenase 3 maturation protease
VKRVLVGVGNRLSHDDGIGPVVAARLDGAQDWLCVDCGTALENTCGLIVRESPDLLVVVDAARMGLRPGSIRRVPLRAHDRMLASTHGLPIAFVWERIATAVGRIVLVGVEPVDLSFGEGLSPAVSLAADALLARLRVPDIEGIPEYPARGAETSRLCDARRREQVGPS